MQVLIALLIFYGSGAITTRRTKRAVLGDRLQTPERAQIRKAIVQASYPVGAYCYVFCVNVDAVIADILLALVWGDYRKGSLLQDHPANAAFPIFLYNRMIEAAADIDDHLNCRRNMDTRPPALEYFYVI